MEIRALTIIAYKDGILAADSGVWNANHVTHVPFPKITRGADGSLWAMAGKMSDAWSLRVWVLAGMDHDNPPIFDTDKDNDHPNLFMVKPDGGLWMLRAPWRFVFGGAQDQPAAQGCWGENDASTFCEGAMAAGLSAPDAVALTIRHHTYAHGEVQVEHAGKPI